MVAYAHATIEQLEFARHNGLSLTRMPLRPQGPFVRAACTGAPLNGATLWELRTRGLAAPLCPRCRSLIEQALTEFNALKVLTQWKASIKEGSGDSSPGSTPNDPQPDLLTQRKNESEW